MKKKQKQKKNTTLLILPPKAIRSKPWINRMLKFKPSVPAMCVTTTEPFWNLEDNHFYGFYVTGLFPFINFCSCCRLQMADTSLLLGSFGYGNNASGRKCPLFYTPRSHTPTFITALLFLPICIPSQRKGIDMSVLCLSLWKKKKVSFYFGICTRIWFSGSVKT